MLRSILLPSLLCAVALFMLPVSALEHKLEKSMSHEFDIQPRTAEYYCFGQGDTPIGWQSLFNEVQVNVVDTSATDFPWHAVKGSSTDDIHSHVEKVLFKALGTPPGHQQINGNIDENSLIWDVLSSCPSPLHATNLHSCSMTFSTIGKSCVSINSDKPQHVSITATEKLNPQYVYNLLAGLILITSAPFLARSKLFQYGTGSFIFISGGVVIMILYLAMKVLSGQRSALSWMRYTLMGMLFSTGYGAALIWFLRHNLSVVMLEYWEWVVTYLSVFCVLGLWWVWLVRSNEQSKENVQFVVNWVVRMIGIVAVYNGSASPLGSLLLIFAVVAGSICYNCYCSRPEKQVVTHELPADTKNIVMTV